MSATASDARSRRARTIRTTDAAPPTLRSTTPSTRRHPRLAWRARRSLVDGADDERPQGHRAALHRQPRCWRALIVGVLGVLLGAERIDGEGTLLDVERDAPDVRRVPRRARVRRRSCRCCSASPWRSCRCRSAPGRSPSRELAAAGFWTWFGGVVIAHRRPVQQRRARSVATPRWSTCSSPPTSLMSSGSPPVAGDDRRIGAHHPGAGHAHADGCRSSPGRRWWPRSGCCWCCRSWSAC